MVTSDVIVFEAKDTIGGMWVYQPFSELTHPDLQNDIFYKYSGFLHSSMYDPLSTNVPFMSMTFADFPYPQANAVGRKSGNTNIYQKLTEGDSLFEAQCTNLLNRAQFLEYIEEYAHYFKLNQYVRLGHFVKTVRYLPALDQEEINEWKQRLGTLKKFLLEVIKLNEHGVEESLYFACDFLINANGHYSVKNTPNLPGLQSYSGDQIHMHDLRKIGDIKAEKILVLGGSFGAMDLVWQLLYDFPDNYTNLYFCGKVAHLSTSQELKPFLTSSVLTLKPFLKEFKGGKHVVFEDDSEIEDADLIIWATGYQSSFPYFEQTGDKLFHGLFDIYARRSSSTCPEGFKAFGPLFLHCLSAREPHLMFNGLVERGIANGYINSICAMFLACIVGGFISFDSDYLLEEAEKELEEFRSKNPSLMKFGAYTSIFGLNDHARQLLKIMCHNEEDSKEILQQVQYLEYLLLSNIKEGRFKKYKSLNFLEEIHKGRFYQFDTPTYLFSRRIRHTKEGIKIIEKSD